MEEKEAMLRAMQIQVEGEEPTIWPMAHPAGPTQEMPKAVRLD